MSSAPAQSNITQLQAKTRTTGGKGAARRLRNEGDIPAIAYGGGEKATAIAVNPKDVLSVLRSERGKNSVLEVQVEGAQKLLVMIRDYSYHPLDRHLEHVDFIKVEMGTQVETSVPLFSVGKPAGVTMGGVLRQVFRELPIRSLPNQIPLKIEVDVSHLNLNEHVSTKDLKLPDGVTVRLPPEQTLVAVVAPEKDRSEQAADAPAAAAPAGAATPAAAKPGEAAKTPASAPAKDAKKK